MSLTAMKRPRSDFSINEANWALCVKAAFKSSQWVLNSVMCEKIYSIFLKERPSTSAAGILSKPLVIFFFFLSLFLTEQAKMWRNNQLPAQQVIFSRSVSEAKPGKIGVGLHP